MRGDREGDGKKKKKKKNASERESKRVCARGKKGKTNKGKFREKRGDRRDKDDWSSKETKMGDWPTVGQPAIIESDHAGSVRNGQKRSVGKQIADQRADG